MAPILSRHLAVSVAIITTLIAMTMGALIWQPGHSRQRRNVLQMCLLIHLHTDRFCLDYNDYGCFCGIGSAGGRPLDAVDRCCRAHDICYSRLDCLWLPAQLTSYSYMCREGRCRCTDLQNSCYYATCQCDLKLARCFGRSEFNESFMNFNWSNCISTASPTTTTENVTSI